MMLLIVMLLATNYRATESFGLDVIGNVQTTANFFNDAVGVIKGDLPISSLLTGSTGVMLDKILDSVGAMSDKMDGISASFTTALKESDMKNEKHFHAIEAAIERVLVEIPMTGKLTEDMREFRAYVTRVNSLYREYEFFSRNKTIFNEQTSNYLVEAIVSRNRGDLFDVLQQLYYLIVQEDWYYTQGIMELYSDSIRKSGTEKLCGVGLSPQGRYYKMYETIYMAEARGFIMKMFAYSVKSAYTRKPYEVELNLAKTAAVGRLKKYFLITVDEMEGLAVDVELCDEPKYDEGINYAEVRSFASKDITQGISLMERKANVNENMVVCGVRFFQHPNGMIDYQIKEAKFLPQGQVAQHGTWVKPEVKDKLEESKDADDVREYETIFIDDLHLAPGYVLVGVDLESTDWTSYTYLSICGMKFNSTTGQLELGSEKWIDFMTPHAVKSTEYRHRRVIKDPGRLHPLTADRNFINSKPNEELKFRSTDDRSHKPSIIPFFDTRPVEMSSPNLALAGVGLYHRGTPEHGGFLNFRLITSDVYSFMKKHDSI